MRVGKHDRRVSLWRGPIETDDRDGYYERLAPDWWWCSIQPLIPQQNGRLITSLVSMRYHRQVTVDTRIVVQGDDPRTGRQLLVLGVQDVDDAHVEMRCLCQEIVP